MAKITAHRIDLDQILADPQSRDSQRLRRVLLDHLADACPAWLWDVRNGELIWQNDAAQMYSSKRAGKKSKSVTPDAMKGQLRRILNITPVGQETLSRLHFSTGKKPFDRICRCTPMQLAGHKHIGLLSVSVEPVGIFDKVEAASLFSTAHSLGFAAALVQRGGVLLEQSEKFGEMIGNEFDSELIVGLSSAARHGNPIAVESENGRREFYIARVSSKDGSKDSGKNKSYLALIDFVGGMGAKEAPVEEDLVPDEIDLVARVDEVQTEEKAVEDASSEDAQTDETDAKTLSPDEPRTEEKSVPSSAGPLSALIDQLSGLTPYGTDRTDDAGANALDLPVDLDEINAGPATPVDAGTVETESVTVEGDARTSLSLEAQDAPLGLPTEFSSEHLSEQDRYNFDEVSRILTHRLTSDASGRKRHLRAVVSGVHSAGEVSDLTTLSARKSGLRSGNGAAADGSIVLNQDHLILNRLPLGILIYRDQQIMFANRAMVKLLGYTTSEELRKRGIASVIPESDDASDFGPLAQLVNRQGNSFDVSVRLQTANWLGQPCFMITAQGSEPIPAPDGAALSAAFFEDVARRLRGPLNSISGFGEMLQMQEFGQLGHLRYSEYAGDIVTAAHQASVIIDEASELTRLASGNATFEQEVVNMTALLERAVGRVRAQANSAQIVIRDNISEHLPDVVGDVMSIAKIVLNLLANAIHVAPSGGQVILTADQNANQTKVEIHIRHSGGHDIQPGLRDDFLLLHPQGFEGVRAPADKEGEPDHSASGFGLRLIETLAETNAISISLQTLSDQDSLMEISIPIDPRN